MFGLTAVGGGKGGSGLQAGSSGGSGGGGGRSSSGSGGLGQAGGAGTSGQGNSGGYGFLHVNGAGGGGGGAGAAGTNATNTDQFAGNGGIGIASSITGTSVYYGGGGGGGAGNVGASNGTGGNGGGGNGGGSVGGAGTANRGGGGGGGQFGGTGGAGGSGVIILSYNGAVQTSTTYDSMIDSPTVSASASNYAVINRLDLGGGSSSSFLVAGNLNFGDTTDGSAGDGNSAGFRSTIGVSSGKWYIEGTKLNATTNQRGFGFGTPTIALGSWNGGPTNNLTTSNDQFIGFDPNTAVAFFKTGSNAATTVASSITTSQNTVYAIALDLDNSQVSFYVNGTQVGSTTSFTKPSATSQYFVTFSQSATWNRPGLSLNFGQRPFSYTPPTGFNALNTYNLPAPSIANGAQYMAATTYTANGGVQTINNGTNNTIGTTFQPDLVWTKPRSNVGGNIINDSVRGASLYLTTNTTNAELTDANYLTSFNSNGFSLGSTNFTNGYTMVGWQWKAGGTGVTNTSGTITSTVSANPTAGFSIVTYTGTGSGSPTIGHGLGVAPSMIIVKSRSNAVNWGVGHVSAGWANAGLLNGTNAFGGSTYFASTAPTSTVFSVQDATVTNISGATYVAYCFSAVRGYSAFGSYTGNGSADGPFIYTGFRPRWVLYKNASTAGTVWNLHDTSRKTFNVDDTTLDPSSSGAEGTSTSIMIDELSNGFKIRGVHAGGHNNTNGSTYIYAAFAEHPFNYSRAR
jgi:hypothetical protein